MRVAYFDCVAGASGDMILGALLDTGVALPRLREEIDKLSLPGFTLEAGREKRGAIAATKATVVRSGEDRNRRHLSDIVRLLEASALSGRVKTQAQAIFRRLAEAEAGVHGIPAEEVHFHEVGAVDAIVDVVGACAVLELLEIEQVYCSALPSGGGTVECAHGVIPIPAPATIALLAAARAPLRPSPTAEAAAVELVTPTGAAILTTLATFEQPALTVTAVGYGAGDRILQSLPNVLRVWIGDISEAPRTSGFVLLETNIDDMNPELFGYVLHLLLDAGARDVWFTPIQMKKNRPATLLSAIAPAHLEGEIAAMILRETSTLGIRVQEMRRWEAGREIRSFPSSLGEAVVKLKLLGEAVVGVAPEYDSCLAIARANDLPLQEVFQRVAEEARARFRKRRRSQP